ncbi:MAG TPA: hypothetical protein VHI32_16835 [Burkholderiales bacterium]|jgi:hypothetical protein|nr:hypothetical protein [Burkholderiales bacterium]
MATERTPFDSIEDSLEYIGLLREAIETSKKAVDAQAVAAQAEGAQRRLEALQLVAYKLDRLAWHTDGSRRILNDLRILRRLLLGGRHRKRG